MQSQGLAKQITALFAAAVATMPEPVRLAGYAVVLLVVVDMITGVNAAARKGQVSSEKMRTNLWVKLKQYIGIVGIFGAIALPLQNQWVLLPALAMVMTMEITSIHENIIRAQKEGGRPLPPFARAWFERAEKALILSAQAPLAVVAANDEKEKVG